VDVDNTGVPAAGLTLSLSCCDGVAARDSCNLEPDLAGSQSREEGGCVEGEAVGRL
jgi:hypothetical protein